MPSRIPAILALIFAASLLTACGGGGGDDNNSPTPTTSPISGAWQGKTAQGDPMYALVLDDGTSWVVEITPNAVPVAQLHATVQASGGSLSATDAVDVAYSAQAFYRGSIQGSYVQGSSLSASFTPSGGTAGPTDTLAPVPASTYNYNRPASLDDLTGNWVANGTPISISASGAITATLSTNCQLTGSASPHPGGKNVFDLVLTEGSGCPLPGQNIPGVAVTWGSGTSAEMLVATQQDLGSSVVSITAFATR